MDKVKLKNLPQNPGCYLFTNKNGKVIYVGKAKNLRQRVRSYFPPRTDLAPAKQQMVKEVKNIKTIIVNNETEAWLLEINLIKQHRPKYNVVMKDDKNFCYLKIILKPTPQAKVTRRLERDKNAKYYGPYLSAGSLRQLLKLLKYFATPKQRKQTISNITKFLLGQSEPIISGLQTKMAAAAANRNFELAAIWRDRLSAIQKISARQTVVSRLNKNQDIISLFSWQGKNIINLFRIRQGKLIAKINLNLKAASANPPEIIGNFITQYYKEVPNPPAEIIIPQPVSVSASTLSKLTGKKIRIIVPQKGKYKKLIRLGELNAQHYLQTDLPNFDNKKKLAGPAASQLKKSLAINELERMECYDVSNIQGRHAVGAMVVFTNGRPDKSQYRRFKIKYTNGINDFAMLSEIIARRFRHLDWRWPQLIIIDGGQGQLSAVLKTLQSLNIKIPTVALAKKREEIFLPNRSKPLQLKANSPELFLIQKIRDEAHRFAITYYRKRQRHASFSSQLDWLPGIGEKTKQKILKRYKTLSALKSTTKKDLTKLIGPYLAKIIMRHFTIKD